MIVFQSVFGYVPSIIKPCLESVKRVYPDVQVFNFEKRDNPIADSDNFMIDMLKDLDDILHIDWDYFFLDETDKPFDIVKNGLPCVNFLENAPDYSVVYSPDKRFWIDLDEERADRCIDKNTYGWIRKLLRGKKVNRIPNGEYQHLRYSGHRMGRFKD